MAPVPTATPDGAKIGQLIWDAGYSKVGFARQLRRGTVRTIYNVCNNNQRSSVELIREIARVLRVRPSEISDLPPEGDPVEAPGGELRPTG